MNIEKIIITPEVAQNLLEKNHHNRPLMMDHVKVLAEEMRAGRWKFNGATICMNGDRLLDGQHRLQACVLSNRPFETLLVQGIDSDAFDTIDGGRKRKSSDVLSILGEKNTSCLASALVFVDQYMTGSLLRRQGYTNTKIQDLLEKYEGIRESVSFTVKHKPRGIVPPGVLTGCHFLFSQKDKDLADLFCESLIKGSGLREGEPVYLLRERLIQNTLSKAKLDRANIAALFIKAWNHTRKGDPVKSLRWRTVGPKSESFPLVK